MRLKVKELCKALKRKAIYGDVDRADYFDVRKTFEKDNALKALIFSTIAFLLTGIMCIISIKEGTLSSSRRVYECGVLASVIQIVIAFIALKVRKLSYVSVYMAVIAYLTYGLMLGVVTRPNEQTVTFIVLLLYVPLLFTDRPIRMAFVQFVFICIFIVLAIPAKRQDILNVDIVDVIVFGVLSIATICILYCSKIREFRNKIKLQHLSETDQLTGMKNRNCYEKDKQKLLTGNTILSCIYIDVNELHEINNTQGHHAGDVMLCFVADSIKSYFGKNNSYRIGGDEFVIFTFDADKSVIERKIKQIEKEVTAEGYHIATGYSFSGMLDTNLEDVIKQAEAIMYKNKVAYYKEKGLEIRTIKKDLLI